MLLMAIIRQIILTVIQPSNPTNDKYVIGTSVTLTAIADAGFQFDVSNLSKGIYLIKIIT